MPAKGYIQVRAYESFAQIPLENVSVTIAAADDTVLAMRLTDRSGKIDAVEVPTPEIGQSQSPGIMDRPFTTITLRAWKNGYEQIVADNVQIFADTVTLQELEMIPISELPNRWDQLESFDTPPQNL